MAPSDLEAVDVLEGAVKGLGLLPHRAEVAIQPIEGRSDDVLRRVRNVAAVEQNEFLVLGGGALEIEHGPKLAFQRRPEVVPPVDHQHRNGGSWREVEGQGFRRTTRRGSGETARDENARFEPVFHRGEDGAPRRPEAQTAEREAVAVDVVAGLEIVDGTLQVLARTNDDVTLVVEAVDGNLPLVGAGVDRVHQGAPAADEEGDHEHSGVAAVVEIEGGRAREEDDRLVRRLDVLRQEQVGRYALVAVGRGKGDPLPPPVRRAVVDRLEWPSSSLRS